MDRKEFFHLTAGGTAAAALPFLRLPNNNKITKPAPLQRGDTIGLVSPASIVGTAEEYDEAKTQIQDLGYKVKEGDNARNRYGYFAGTDQQRAEDINAMFADSSVDAIMAYRGGWGCNRILEYIDYDLITSNPKIIVGYSDITSLLLAIYQKTGLITFHGPVATSDWTDFSISHFQKATGSSESFSLDTRYNIFSEDERYLVTQRKGRARGKLLGGNLTLLTSMIGSDYLPEWEGNILFVEDVGEDIYRIDRMLSQLKLSGILNKISGFIFGQCTSCKSSDPQGFSLQQILNQHIKPLGIPAFSGTHIGHIGNMFTLPVGAPVLIDAAEGSIRVTASATA